MSLIDIFTAFGVGFFCFLAFRFLKNLETKDTEVQVIAIDLLLLEKINNIYYAYLGNTFVGQSNNIDELVLNMRDFHNVKFFNYDTIENLTNEENNLVKQSIEKWYTII